MSFADISQKFATVFLSACVAFCTFVIVVPAALIALTPDVAHAQTSDGMLVIGVDPGHGGLDGGSGANGLIEKKINWAIANALVNELNTYKGVKAVLSKDQDSYIPEIAQRIINLRSLGADVVISCHCNCTAAGGIDGLEVYIPNASSYNYYTHEQGAGLAAAIRQQLCSQVGFKDRGTLTRNASNGETYADGSTADYYDINNYARKVGLTGIIIEHGYINGPTDASILSDASKVTQCGIADAQAIASYYGLSKATAIASPAAQTVAGYTLSLDVSGMGVTSSSKVYMDGHAYDITLDGNTATVTLPAGGTSLTFYSYNTSIADYDKTYPTAMYVWLLRDTGSGYEVTRATDFDNCMQYAGCSIKIAGQNGIRMITGVPTDLRKTLIYANVYGYTLQEYGTVCAWESALSGADLVLGGTGAVSAYAYKKNTSDPIYFQGKTTQYTNVLVGFPMSKVGNNFALRSYMKISNGTNTVTLYGATVYRSIGYIAQQNANAFSAGSDAYNYVHNIIDYVSKS